MNGTSIKIYQMQVAVQNNKMKRQSEVLLNKLTPGDQLHKALMEIEDLTEKLNEQRKHYDAEVRYISWLEVRYIP